MPEHEQKGGAGAPKAAEGKPAGAFDPAPLEAAEAQAAELAGAAPPADGGSAEKQAAEAAEKARLAKAEAAWKKFLGKKLGAKAFEEVHKVVGYEALQGYAKDGVDSLSKAVAGGGFFKPTEEGKLGGLMDEEAEAEALNKLVAALEPEIKKLALKLVESEIGQKLLKKVAHWTEEHPVTVTTILTTLLIGGAVAAYLANMEIPELKKTFKLGKGFELEAGVQLGKLQEISLQAITVGVKYEADGLKASLKAVHEEEGGTSVTASVGVQGGKGDTTGKASGDVTVTGEGEITVKATGELKTLVSGHDVTAQGGASHSSTDDKTRIEGKVVLGKDGETRSVSGHYSPGDDSFKLTVGHSVDGGKAKRETSVGRDGEGEVTTEDKVTYKPSDDVEVSVAQGTKGDAETFSLGAAFDIGKFETKLDLDMEGAKTQLGVGDRKSVV